MFFLKYLRKIFFSKLSVKYQDSVSIFTQLQTLIVGDGMSLT